MKIKTLTLNNFRAFPGPESQTFTLDGKNLLVYGENGSGKSSVFHALKMFFTLEGVKSVDKTYNVFSQVPNDDHWIEIEFDDGGNRVRWTGPPTSTGNTVRFDILPPGTPVRRIGPLTTATWTSDSRVVSAALRRGCLDYRALLDTNYGHGDDKVNLFKIAVSTLLADYSVATRGGGTTTIGELWNAVEAKQWSDQERTKPIRRIERNLASIAQSCSDFNQGFRQALEAIMLKVKMLIEDMNVEKMQLDDFNFPGITYDRNTRSVQGTELEPIVNFRGYPVSRPQHFLNEARLSALGLAIYLAGRLASVPPGGNDLKLLVLDDVLIGIDLSNRLPLLDLLREHFKEWQIVLLTHDRVWFEMARLHTQGGGEWNCLEIYDRLCALRLIPYPIIRKVNKNAAKACLENAKHFLDTGYEPAAANYTRSAFELTLKVFCQRFDVPVRYKLEARTQGSEDLLIGVEAWLKDLQHPFLDLTLERVKMFRRVVLNEGSHSSPPTIARSEIEGAISAVGALLKLTDIKSDADVNILAKAIELANSANSNDWIPSLGYIRGAMAVRLRKFCYNKDIPIPFQKRDVHILWSIVYKDHAKLFSGALSNVPADIETERKWLIDPISDSQLTALTQADLHRLIAILKKWP